MILVITFLGTCFDVFIVKYSNITKLSTGKRCLIAFSIPRNFSSVWDTSNTTETNLGCLHGFRFLTIGWVVMGHTYALTNHQAFGESLTHSLTHSHSLSLSLPLHILLILWNEILFFRLVNSQRISNHGNCY